MDFETRVRNALEEIKPIVQEDGGDFQFVKIEETTVFIKFEGACKSCPFTFLTLTFGIEENLQKLVPEVSEVVALD